MSASNVWAAETDDDVCGKYSTSELSLPNALSINPNALFGPKRSLSSSIF